MIMAIVSYEFDHVVGVDTHARTHTLVAVKASNGARIQAGTFPATKGGYARAGTWIGKHAPGKVLVASEGTGSYGAQLAQSLAGAGFRVAEMEAPRRHDRKAGKSDVIDAESAARRALALDTTALAQPRTGTGDRVALQVLLTARHALSKSRTSAVNQLTALARIHDLGVDARKHLADSTITRIGAWRTRDGEDAGTACARAEAVRLAREIHRRDTELAANQKNLARHVKTLAPTLTDDHHQGIGPIVAAQILVSYSHPGRIRSEAAFARLAGVAPIPASSGNTNRHRLHRGGDRALNSALWRIAFWRLHHDPNSHAYIQRRKADGKTDKEILRILKRYISRALFRELNTLTA